MRSYRLFYVASKVLVDDCRGCFRQQESHTQDGLGRSSHLARKQIRPDTIAGQRIFGYSDPNGFA